MSFSKSTAKRFVEPASAGPPVGSYDVSKVNSKTHSAVIFEKEARFKDKKDQTPGPADTQPDNLNVSNISNVPFATPCTPMKRKNRILSSSASDLTCKEDLTKQLRHSEHKIYELEKNLQCTNKEKEIAVKSIKQLTTEREDLLIQLANQNQINKEQFYQSEKELNQEISDLQQQQINLESQKQSLEADLDYAEKNMTALRQQLENLENQRTQMLLQTENLESTITQLQTLLDQVRCEKRMLEEHLSALQCENLEHELKCREMGENLEERETDLCTVKEQLEEEKRTCEDLRGNSSELTHLIESTRQENTSLKENIFNLEKSNDLLETKNADMNIELCKSRSEKADLEEQIEYLENTTTESLRCLTLKFESLEMEHDDMQKEFQEKEKLLNSELELTKISNKSIKEDYDGMKNSYKALRNDYTAVVLEADDLENRCKETEQMLVKAEEERQKLDRLLESENLKSEKEKSELKLELERVTETQKNKETESLKQAEEIENLRRLNKEQIEEQEILFRRIDKLNEKLEVRDLKLQRAEEEFEAELSVKDEMMLKIREELGKRIVDTQTKLSRAEQAFNSKLEDEEANYNLLLEENERLQSGSGIEKLNGEVELWRTRYEELVAKVKPFQSQLEQFENERLALVSENSSKESEIAKLANRYAQILGHQNNKQKIHHVIKIKEENLMLKKELTKLRTQIAKEKNSKKQASPSGVRKPRFDRSKAFQHSGKENQVP